MRLKHMISFAIWKTSSATDENSWFWLSDTIDNSLHIEESPLSLSLSLLLSYTVILLLTIGLIMWAKIELSWRMHQNPLVNGHTTYCHAYDSILKNRIPFREMEPTKRKFSNFARKEKEGQAVCPAERLPNSVNRKHRIFIRNSFDTHPNNNRLRVLSRRRQVSASRTKDTDTPTKDVE